MSDASHIKSQDRDLQKLVGTLLRAGVIVALAISTLGIILLLFQANASVPNASNFPDDPAKFNFHEWTYKLMHLGPRSVISFGVLILICTPVLRIIFAMAGYLREKDYLYVAVSLIVLLIIFISIVLGIAH